MSVVTAYWYVAPSPIAGHGVFPTASIGRGTTIGLAHWYDGRQWRATRLGSLHNHSLTPNAESVRVGNQRFLVAARDIFPGEEITVDYRLQPELEQPQPGWR